MDRARQILEQALSYKNCEGLIEENSRLEDAVLYAINEALLNPPTCEVCGSKNVTDPISETVQNGFCSDCGYHW